MSRAACVFKSNITKTILLLLASYFRSYLIHLLNRWTGWLRWEFGHLFCVPDTDDLKQKNKKSRKHTKQIFLEQKTKKSFVLHHLCPVHEILTGIWNPLISGQIINSFGQGKCTFDCQSWNLKNYATGNHVLTSSCMLRIEKLITFNVTCMWTFHTNSLLHEYLFLMHVHK